MAIPPALGETSTVKFGPVTLKIRCEIVPTQSAFFGKTYFDPKGVLHPQIFTRARESPSLTSAFPTGDGGPLTTFFKGGQKLA